MRKKKPASPAGDTGAPEAEAGDAGAAAGDQERSPVDDETLAAQWAEALAEDEEDKSGPSTSAARAREAAARPRTPTSRI